jgi:hypothetical protein
MLIYAFAILIIYLVSKNSIYVIFYKYFSDSIQEAKAYIKLEKGLEKGLEKSLEI